MASTVITLTTIPPRMGSIGEALHSILNQTAAVDSVQLWLPRKYRRKQFEGYRPPELPRGVELVYTDFDYGPATKILPAARRYRGQDVNIIYCDDDHVYDPDWAESLIDAAAESPGSCMAAVGLNVETLKLLAWRRTPWSRTLGALTLGRHRRDLAARIAALKTTAGPVDIAQGFGGVLVRPDMIPEAAYDIPGVLWMVDDIWLSGHLQNGGIPIVQVSDAKKCRKSGAANIEDLTRSVFQGRDRIGADMECVRYFQRQYGLWR